MIFGEVHSTPSIVAVQHSVQKAMVSKIPPPGKLHVVMEHFSLDMQPLLDSYCRGATDLKELDLAYRANGTEGHSIKEYEPVLEFAREHPDRCEVHGGFVPRTYAKTLMREGVGKALAAAKDKGFVSADEDCQATESHFRYFESLLTGQDPFDSSRSLTERFRPMLPAQVLKDASMAHRVNRLVKASDEAGKEDRVLVLCGNGHMGFGHGVPERVREREGWGAPTTVYSRPALLPVDDEKGGLKMPEDMAGVLGGVVPGGVVPGGVAPGTGAAPPAADFCLVYQDAAAISAAAEAAEALRVKQETSDAYDRVGDTAHLTGDLKKAERVMTLLGYSAEEIAFAGRDAYNYQGVGHPHKHARISEGEVVLDLGSGLGIDSLIASSKVGEEGRVVGVDISEREVRHASKRASERGANVRFVQADLEDLPIPDACIDVVISNGAFCLAPNKRQGFREAFRVLKPGGRMVVCTSTNKKDLSGEVKWPVCMRVFAPLGELEPMVREVGFEDVFIDLSDSLMAQEVKVEEEEEEEVVVEVEKSRLATLVDRLGEEKKEEEEGGGRQDARGRKQVHGGGGKEFRHLENYDMNELCARVVVVARKPTSATGGDQEEAGLKEAAFQGGGCPYADVED